MTDFLLDLEFDGLPPTVNHMYRGAKGWRYLTPETREFQDRITALLKEHWQGKELFTGRVALSITFFTNSKRRWDIDNRVKALQDCLEKAAVIKNDTQIDALHVERKISSKDSTRITLCEYNV